MNKIFIDTNIWLRLILQDNDQFYDCKKLIEEVKNGALRTYISNIVILEINYVLSSSYKLSRKRIGSHLSPIINLRSLNIIDETDTNLALQYYQKYNIKLGDCYIAAQLPSNTTLITYDSDFQKIPHLKSQTPTQFLNQP